MLDKNRVWLISSKRLHLKLAMIGYVNPGFKRNSLPLLVLVAAFLAFLVDGGLLLGHLWVDLGLLSVLPGEGLGPESVLG